MEIYPECHIIRLSNLCQNNLKLYTSCIINYNCDYGGYYIFYNYITQEIFCINAVYICNVYDVDGNFKRTLGNINRIHCIDVYSNLFYNIQNGYIYAYRCSDGSLFGYKKISLGRLLQHDGDEYLNFNHISGQLTLYSRDMTRLATIKPF